MFNEETIEAIERLCENKSILSYKGICEYLGLSYKKTGSNSQKAQLKQIQQFCTLQKISTGYMFSEFREGAQKQGNNILVRMGLDYEDSIAECMYVLKWGEREYIGRAKVLYKKYLYHLDRAKINEWYLEGMFMYEHNLEIVMRGKVSDEEYEAYKQQRREAGAHIINDYTGVNLGELSAVIEKYGAEYGYTTKKIVERLIKAFENDDPYIRKNLLYMVR